MKLFKFIIDAAVNCIIIITCVVLCIYFMMEILFSLGTAHHDYVLNLCAGVISHITGCICCIYVSLYYFRKKLNIKSRETCDNSNAGSAVVSTGRSKSNTLFALAGSFILLLTFSFSAVYYFAECVSFLFPLSPNSLKDWFLEYATHIAGCFSCIYAMIKTIKYMTTIRRKKIFETIEQHHS